MRWDEMGYRVEVSKQGLNGAGWVLNRILLHAWMDMDMNMNMNMNMYVSSDALTLLSSLTYPVSSSLVLSSKCAVT